MKDYKYKGVIINKEYLEGQPMPLCMDNITDETMNNIAEQIYNDFSRQLRYTDDEIKKFFNGTLDDDRLCDEMDDNLLADFERLSLENGAKYYD